MSVIHGMMQSKITIGITGGSGCGKSVVSAAAESLGFVHIDTDLIAHDVILKPRYAYTELLRIFGDSILRDDGEIDRKKLGSIVFSDSEKLEILNSVTHPQIEKDVRKMLADKTVIDGAVLHKSPGILNLCDCIITVTNSDKRRIDFICARDGISRSDAKKRIQSQPGNEFYSSFADYVINSDGGKDELFDKSVEIIKRCIIEKAR